MFFREQAVLNDTLFPPISTTRLLIFLPDCIDPILALYLVWTIDTKTKLWNGLPWGRFPLEINWPR